MTTLRIQCSLPSTNTIPADAATNTWHFISDAVDRLDDANEIIGALDDFYNAVEGIFSIWLAGDVNVKCYDLEDPEPRAPFLTDSFTFTPQSGIALPAECAIAMSYESAPISGIPIGRRRGRIFLGPLDADVVSNGANGLVVNPTFCTIIADAGQALMNEGTGHTWKWAVFSPTRAGAQPWSAGDLLASTNSVAAGHVDDAFDTIRSRGTAAENRVSW